MGIDLKSFIYTPSPKVDYSSVDIVNKIKKDLNAKDYKKSGNLETVGYMDVTYLEGGISWAVSGLIEFAYQYTTLPFMSWSLEGTYSGDTTNASPYSTVGGNSYSKDLPSPLLTYLGNDDTTTYSPAIFVPRIVHWWKKTPITYSGCYLLITQVNPDCTEIANKICRIHFKFSGPGYL